MRWTQDLTVGLFSGELTESGLPLVGGDSHRALDTPSVYYQVHLSCPEFTVIGHAVPGMPGALHFLPQRTCGVGDDARWGGYAGSLHRTFP